MPRKNKLEQAEAVDEVVAELDDEVVAELEQVVTELEQQVTAISNNKQNTERVVI